MAVITGQDAGPFPRVHAVTGPDAGQLPRYARVLTARFAAHGPGGKPQRCLCGAARPCVEELRVAELLELVAGACR
jgi:hypothetical protein